jgi:hypothetical protein
VFLKYWRTPSCKLFAIMPRKNIQQQIMAHGSLNSSQKAGHKTTQDVGQQGRLKGTTGGIGNKMMANLSVSSIGQ